MDMLKGSAPFSGYHPVSEPQSDYMKGTGPQKDKDVELGDIASDAFFDEVASLREQNRTFDSTFTSIQSLHSLSLSSPSPEATEEIKSKSERLTAEFRMAKNRIAALGLLVGKDEARRGHWETLKGNLSRAVQRWESIEMAHREKIRERVARQFQIVKPEATEAELKEVLDSGNGGQIFQQAVAGSRIEGAQAALSEAQSRRAEVLKIEATLSELAVLFNQVAELVATQDQQFITTEDSTKDVMDNLEKGTNEITLAKLSAAGARHKRKICAAFFGMILLVLIIVIAAEVGSSGGGPPSSSASTTASTTGSTTGSSSGSATSKTTFIASLVTSTSSASAKTTSSA